MMTNKELENFKNELLPQINQAFEADRKRIDALEKKVEELSRPKVGRPKKDAA